MLHVHTDTTAMCGRLSGRKLSELKDGPPPHLARQLNTFLQIIPGEVPHSLQHVPNLDPLSIVVWFVQEPQALERLPPVRH